MSYCTTFLIPSQKLLYSRKSCLQVCSQMSLLYNASISLLYPRVMQHHELEASYRLSCWLKWKLGMRLESSLPLIQSANLLYQKAITHMHKQHIFSEATIPTTAFASETCDLLYVNWCWLSSHSPWHWVTAAWGNHSSLFQNTFLRFSSTAIASQAL